jgi:hypothetical protein
VFRAGGLGGLAHLAQAVLKRKASSPSSILVVWNKNKESGAVSVSAAISSKKPNFAVSLNGGCRVGNFNAQGGCPLAFNVHSFTSLDVSDSSQLGAQAGYVGPGNSSTLGKGRASTSALEAASAV